MISFVVPAHNEQALIGRTLAAIHDTAREIGLPYEVIVVDDASTDATAEIAQQNNAGVVSVNHRQIAATRNSGARAAQGDRLFFVDADTTINARAVSAALRAMDNGAVGGGCPARFDGYVPLYTRLLIWWLGWMMRLVGLAAGAFQFSTRTAFLATGGYDERLYGAEDAAFSWALKREGKFVIIWPHVMTSGRRARGMNGLRMVATLLRIAFFPGILRQRHSVGNVWYDSDRDSDEIVSTSLAVRLSNFLALIILLAIISGPLWLIPWPEWLENGPLGYVKFAVQVIGLHVGILLLPCSYFVARALPRQKRWVERIKFAIMLALCVWLALGNTLELIRFYRWIVEALMNSFRGG